MKYIAGHNSNIIVVRWAIISIFLIILGYILTSDSEIESKFNEQTANYQYNYCAGVFTFGLANGTMGEQTETFGKAVEWFKERADATGGKNNSVFQEAITDLEVTAAQGNDDEFKSIGYRCADIAINERQ